MTNDASSLPATMLAETIHLPYAITLRSVNLFWDLLQALLGERGNFVVLDSIEGHPVKGREINLSCGGPATFRLLRDVQERTCRQDDPLSLLWIFNGQLNCPAGQWEKVLGNAHRNSSASTPTQVVKQP